MAGTADMAEKAEPTRETMSEANTAVRTLARVVKRIFSDLATRPNGDVKFSGAASAEDSNIVNPEWPD